jgi:hypothetical protein
MPDICATKRREDNGWWEDTNRVPNMTDASEKTSTHEPRQSITNSSIRRFPMAESLGMHSANKLPKKASASTNIDTQSACNQK